MYKILLVDDEKMVLKSLIASIDWQNYGFTITDTANSAKEAIEKIKALKPDVVFTDIRMPEISGLELLQMIKNTMPGILCVVISGYAEFAYVHEALKLEAIGYCLKPFDYDEITFFLKRIRKNLDALYCSSQGGWFERLESRDDESLAYLDAFFQKNGIDFKQKDIVAAYVKGSVEYVGNCVSANVGYEKKVFLMERAEIENLLEACGTKEHIGVSFSITDIADVRAGVKDARKKAYQFFCQPDCSQVIYEIPESDLAHIRALQVGVECAGYENKIQTIKEHFEKGLYNIDAAVLLYNLMETWQDGDKPGEFSFLWEYDSICAEYGNVCEMLECFRDQLYKLKYGHEPKINNQTFLEIYQYIENNFDKQIKISELAKKFYINNCYISHLFKRETGKTLTEFITEKRISLACSLLKERNLSISAIAEMVGFSEYFYFSKVFRKVMNCTPSEYREQT